MLNVKTLGAVFNMGASLWENYPSKALISNKLLFENFLSQLRNMVTNIRKIVNRFVYFSYQHKPQSCCLPEHSMRLHRWNTLLCYCNKNIDSLIHLFGLFFVWSAGFSMYQIDTNRKNGMIVQVSVVWQFVPFSWLHASKSAKYGQLFGGVSAPCKWLMNHLSYINKVQKFEELSSDCGYQNNW